MTTTKSLARDIFRDFNFFILLMTENNNKNIFKQNFD